MYISCWNEKWQSNRSKCDFDGRIMKNEERLVSQRRLRRFLDDILEYKYGTATVKVIQDF